LKGISFENTYTAYILSQTPIDRVVFKLNNETVFVDTNGDDGWSAKIDTSLFEKSSVLEVIAIDKNGVKSEPYKLGIRVIGIPDWLTFVMKYGNISISSNGEITFEKVIPDPPVDAELDVPSWIPVLGGKQEFEAQVNFKIVYNIPESTAVVAGEGTIEVEILKREAEGQLGAEGTIEVPSFKLKSAKIWGYLKIEVWNIPWKIEGIPIVGDVGIEVGVSPHVRVEGRITAGESINIEGGTISPGVEVEGESKLDLKVAKVEINAVGDLTGSLDIPAPYNPRVTASISASGKVKAGIFEAEVEIGPYEYTYPEQNDGFGGGGGGRVLVIPKEYVKTSGWKVVEKYGGIPAYKVGIKSLTNVMTIKPLAQTEYGRLTLNNVEEENPSVVYVNGSYLVVWSAQDPQKDVKAGHDLYYAIYTPSVGWSEIKKLTDDYLDDRNPVLARFGDKVVCVWTVVNKDLRNENVTSPFDVFPYVEIAYSVYNGTWSESVIITNNSEFEYNLDIYCNSEACIVAWEVDKDLNFTTLNDRVVKVAFLNETNVLEIPNATYPSLAGNYIAYFNPIDNKLVFGLIEPFEVIASYNCSDLMDVDLSCYNDNCTLVWIDNFDLFYADPPNNAIKLDCNCRAYTIDVEDFGAYKLLVFSGKVPGDVKQRILYKIGYNNTWVGERSLAGGASLTFWQVDYAYDNSGFFAVFAGKEKLNDKNDIFYVYHTYAGDLEIYANVSGSYTIDDYVTVNYTVKNVGDQPISDFTVEIYNLNMEKLASKRFGRLEVGATVKDCFNVKLDKSGGFIVKVIAVPDLDESNNIVKLVLLHPDLTVKGLKVSRINNKLIVNVTFENLGIVDVSNVTFKLLNGNRTLYSGIIDLQAGCSVNYTMTVNTTDIDRDLTSCIVIDPENEIPEEREDNNVLYFRTLMTDLSIGTVRAVDNGSSVILRVLVGNSGIGDSTANLTVLDANLTLIKSVMFTINGSNTPVFKEITLVLSYDEWNKAKYVCVEDRYDTDYGNNIAEVEKRLLKMPVAEFTHEPSTLRLFAGKPILFKSISYDLDSNITLYIWNFGDGNVIVTNSSMIVHKYTDVGNYTVMLTVVDDDGLTNSTSKKIVVVRVGDFNGDGTVDIGDVCYVAFIVVGKIKPDMRADFNENGRVDIGDLVRIVYYLLGKIDKL
jgi:PKD repeat protein